MTGSGSGRLWWTAAIPLGMLAVFIAWALWPGAEATRRARHDPQATAARRDLNLSHLLVPMSSLADAGMGPAGLAPLDTPGFLPLRDVEQANNEGRGKFLVSDDRVIGLVIGDDARAYPLRLLRWHEVVNDTVGGVPVAVTYNPLCDSVVVFRREIAGKELHFAVSGLLLNSNLVLRDRQPDRADASLWSQLQARAIAGPAARRQQRLELLDSELCTWASWALRHPQGRVMAAAPEFARLYKRDPYHSYFGSDLIRFPVNPLPPPSTGLRLKDRVVVVDHAGEQVVLSLDRLAERTGSKSGQWHGTIAGMTLSVDFAESPGVASVTVSDASSPTSVRYAFWFAWYAAFPEARAPGP